MSAGADMAPRLSPEGLEFAPQLLAIQERPPAPLPRLVLWIAATLSALLVAWACFGRLDIIASADGRLIPQTYVKIVQPAAAGIVQQILVREGESVRAGQVLLRMDTRDAEADLRTVRAALMAKALKLRRVDAELTGMPMHRQAQDDGDLFRQVDVQFQNNVRLQRDALLHAEETVRRAREDHEAGIAVLSKLRDVLPLLKAEADSYADLGKDGYVPKSTQQEKQREYLEKRHDLAAQESTTRGLAAAVAQAARQRDELVSKYRSDLQNERVEAQNDQARLLQEDAKQAHKGELLELRAPQAGIVKDLATHTTGAVVSPGTVLLSLVPEREPLVAEVLVRNDDVGFVYSQQPVKLKLAAYPFQKYGMLGGRVLRISPDATSEDSATPNGRADGDGDDRQPLARAQAPAYKALVELDSQILDAGGARLRLVPGMQVVAEIDQGQRTVMQYLLSPIASTIHDSARER